MPEKTHDLKTWPEYFAEIANGNKTFELRKNDRDFESGRHRHHRTHGSTRSDPGLSAFVTGIGFPPSSPRRGTGVA